MKSLVIKLAQYSAMKQVWCPVIVKNTSSNRLPIGVQLVSKHGHN